MSDALPRPYQNAICRGSYALGTNCGRYERCSRDRNRIMRVVKAALDVEEAERKTASDVAVAMHNLRAAVFMYRNDRT